MSVICIQSFWTRLSLLWTSPHNDRSDSFKSNFFYFHNLQSEVSNWCRLFRALEEAVCLLL